ncbi:MAG: tetratricopeptide repeat protein, partial [Candidatus Eisenbacteria bacterium]|nr:tetratricopeptide repeat protein [Candidatus Eisenbacteria bacterium]
MSLISALLRWGHNPHYRRGMLHFNRGEFERAADGFERVLGEVHDPHDPDRGLARCYAAEARAKLGLAFFHAGDYGRAETEFMRAPSENPGFPDLRYYRARIYERSGRVAEAIADLEQALAEQPRYVEALLLLAVCRAQDHDLSGSERALERALALGFELPAGLKPAQVG